MLFCGFRSGEIAAICMVSGISARPAAVSDSGTTHELMYREQEYRPHFAGRIPCFDGGQWVSCMHWLGQFSASDERLLLVGTLSYLFSNCFSLFSFSKSLIRWQQ
jgi:hypothetical protein